VGGRLGGGGALNRRIYFFGPGGMKSLLSVFVWIEIRDWRRIQRCAFCGGGGGGGGGVCLENNLLGKFRTS